MARRCAALVPRDFQEPIVARLAEAMIATAGKIIAAPAERRRITQQIGCALLEAPTGSGKTVMLAWTAERVAADAPVVWFWFAPFRGLIEQTMEALRQAAPGLRVRDPRADRGDIGSRPGDVFVATWASVAASNTATRRMRTDDDVAPALDTLVTRLRAAGLLLGAVVDEAHHSFKPNSEAFRFLHDVMRPDLLMLATATPDDDGIKLLGKAMDIARFQRVAVSRAQAVAARLNKSAVKAVAFVARGASARLLDLSEVALRKAVEQHRALRHELRAAGFAVVPLLLIQAASDGWTPDRVRRHLYEQLGFAEGSVGVHTANEPDPDVQALARDPKVEALVFKMAVATGFDAPRASVLCALRPVESAAFGLQVIGRIMRVHPLLQSRRDLPPSLDTAYVFLGEAAGQGGLQQAADRMRAVRSAVEVVTDNVTLYVAGVGGDHRIAIEDEQGQSVLMLTEPSTLEPLPLSVPAAAPADPAPLSLFGQLAAPTPPRAQPSAATNAGLVAPPIARRPYEYPMRRGCPCRSGCARNGCRRMRWCWSTRWWRACASPPRIATWYASGARRSSARR